jgi:hypothetical protein
MELEGTGIAHDQRAGHLSPNTVRLVVSDTSGVV